MKYLLSTTLAATMLLASPVQALTYDEVVGSAAAMIVYIQACDPSYRPPADIWGTINTIIESGNKSTFLLRALKIDGERENFGHDKWCRLVRASFDKSF